MSSALLVHLVAYLSLAAFVGVVAYRFLKVYRMPMHVRWELYPVAHEMGDKPKYGGSRLEELDHWEKEKESSLSNELRYMVPEMTLLVALFEHNRKLWYRSFPFHFGLYMLAGMLGLVILGALMNLAGITVGPFANGQAGIIGNLVYYVTPLVALGGLALGTLGALGLLHARFTDEDLKDYTSFGHIFNLLLFVAVLGVAWLTFIFVDTYFEHTRQLVADLITFQGLRGAAALGAGSADMGIGALSAQASVLLGAEVILATLLIAYIPMTHMSHFFIKWFTYHKIRWEDEANEVGSDIERKVIEQVQYPVTWSASHINADGKKNWLDIVTEEADK